MKVYKNVLKGECWDKKLILLIRPKYEQTKSWHRIRYINKLLLSFLTPHIYLLNSISSPTKKRIMTKFRFLYILSGKLCMFLTWFERRIFSSNLLIWAILSQWVREEIKRKPFCSSKILANQSIKINNAKLFHRKTV